MCLEATRLRKVHQFTSESSQSFPAGIDCDYMMIQSLPDSGWERFLLAEPTDLALITCEANTMQNALSLPRTQPRNNSLFAGSGGETWNWLQNLREDVSGDLLREGPLCQSEILGLREGEESKANTGDIEWLHRAQLEARLREIIDAQDRLLDGTYGRCIECGEQITTGRLLADPAAYLCLNCQKLVESDHQFFTI